MSEPMSEKQRVGSAQRRRSVADEPVTSVLKSDEVYVYDGDLDADEEVLAALGYKYVERGEIYSEHMLILLQT